jgi:hypothetical protein
MYIQHTVYSESYWLQKRLAGIDFSPYWYKCSVSSVRLYQTVERTFMGGHTVGHYKKVSFNEEYKDQWAYIYNVHIHIKA